MERDKPMVVVAIFRARPGRSAALGAALRELVEPTQKEDGCLNYDLHQANDDTDVYFFHETWRSVEDHEAHLETPHVRHVLAISPDLIQEPIREYKGHRTEA